MKRDFDLGPVIFVVAMIMLGVAGAVVVLRHENAPVSQGPRHHYLDSPYQSMLFHRGQLHVQSNRGVGHAYPRDLARAYQRAGYEWVSITDQNTLTPTTQFTTPGIVPLAGAEAQFSFGRLLQFGVDTIQAPANLQAAVDVVRQQAGQVILARPKDPPVVTVDQIAALKGLDAMEIYDARLHHDNPVVSDATDMWDQLLTGNHRIWGVVGDDTLEADGPLSTLGQTAVDVQVPEVTPPLISDAIRRGAFVDSTGIRVLGVDATSNDRIRVITTDATSIEWYGAGGALLATTTGPDGTYTVKWTEKYVRAVATRADGAKAWTQPVFVVP
ncbi:MAG: hypothetical protein QOK05_1700 [Chloroflexota bacterium]|nr:hypothetical protein [Chloroflexota bacterium]